MDDPEEVQEHGMQVEENETVVVRDERVEMADQVHQAIVSGRNDDNVGILDFFFTQ